jgi:hypothetical protein
LLSSFVGLTCAHTTGAAAGFFQDANLPRGGGELR